MAGGFSLGLGQASIVAHFTDAELWLTFNSRWRKSVMRVFSSMDVVWYLVLLLIVSWIRFQFG